MEKWKVKTMGKFEEVLDKIAERLKENPDDVVTREIMLWFLWMWLGNILIKRLEANTNTNQKRRQRLRKQNP
jgi:hypothetical protein